MEPNRPNMEAMPNKDMRNSVGNISAVNTYMVLNAMVMAYLLLKNKNSLVHRQSENKILYITAKAICIDKLHRYLCVHISVLCNL